MSGNFWLDGMLLSISIFNIIIMLWLGLMVLLSAEKRTWGVFFAASGLLAGVLFFVAHAALLGQNIARFTSGVNFWWHLGWAPIIIAPFVWYIVMLWFSGYWQQKISPLRQRHRPWLVLVVVYVILILVFLVFINPVGDLSNSRYLEGSYEGGTGTRIPMLYLAYPVFILLCISLSMDALLRPGPSTRLMGKSARDKARPWLVGASFTLMLTSAIVGYTIGWVLENARESATLPELYGNIAPSLAWIDLALSVLVTIAVLLIGQAIVSYEIFTGKPLPRSGFRRQWTSALAMAGCIALATGLVFQTNLSKIYMLLFVILLAAAFYALFSWRFSEEREQSIRQLRPFLGSQNLASAILTDSPLPISQNDIQNQFRQIAGDVLNLQKAQILPLGKLAGLDITGLVFPAGQTEPVSAAESWLPELHDLKSDPLALPMHSGYNWAVPLWSQRGLDALLLLGEKADDSFLSMEEIETARAAGERLVDLLLTAELARRLVQLQRERFTEQALLDQVPRRMIHDEVLPQVHAAMLELSSKGQESIPAAVNRLGMVHKQLSGLLREMPAPHPEALDERGLLNTLQEMVSREFGQSFHSVNWQAADDFAERSAGISDTAREVIFFAAREAVRNAAKYARTSGGQPVDLTIRCLAEDRLTVEVEDNGQGFDQEKELKRGHGLDLHSLMMTIIGGSLQIQSDPGQFTRIRIEI